MLNLNFVGIFTCDNIPYIMMQCFPFFTFPAYIHGTLGLLAESKRTLTRMRGNNNSSIIQRCDRLLKTTQCFNQHNIHRHKKVFISSKAEPIKNSHGEGAAVKGS